LCEQQESRDFFFKIRKRAPPHKKLKNTTPRWVIVPERKEIEKQGEEQHKKLQKEVDLLAYAQMKREREGPLKSWWQG